jgi:hypothetical protein
MEKKKREMGEGYGSGRRRRSLKEKGCASFRGTINAASVGGDAGRVTVDAGRVARVASME